MKLETRIYYFYKTILEFNYNNIRNFEYVKIKDDIIEHYEGNKKIYSSIINNNINNSFLREKNNKKEQTNLLKNNGNILLEKRNKDSLKNNIEKEPYKIIEQNNINGSFLNGSVNGSSYKFLNASNNKLFLNKNSGNNNDFISPNSGENEQGTESQEQSIDLLLKFSNKILPISRVAFIIIILLILFYICESIGNIYEIYSQKEIWKFSINLSMNLFERIPNLMEMIIYACITVISTELKLLDNSQMKDYNKKYLEFFKADSLYYSEDIMKEYFQNNHYEILLKKNLRINYNLDNYLFQKTYEIFENTKIRETNLRKSGEFCIYAAIYNLIEEGYNNIYDFANLINLISLECLEYNTGINESGAKLEITYISSEITNKYIEFITYNISNITLNQARNNFFNSKDINRILYNIQSPLILYYNSIIQAIIFDFEIQSEKIVSRQNLFSYLSLIINCVVLICLIFIISKNEKYKKLFNYYSEIILN